MNKIHPPTHLFTAIMQFVTLTDFNFFYLLWFIHFNVLCIHLNLALLLHKALIKHSMPGISSFFLVLASCYLVQPALSIISVGICQLVSVNLYIHICSFIYYCIMECTGGVGFMAFLSLRSVTM